MAASQAFLALYDDVSTTDTGRARLLDGSVSRGPFGFWRRVPVDSPPELSREPFFMFTDPDVFPVTLAIDLCLRPPAEGDGPFTICTQCNAREQLRVVAASKELGTANKEAQRADAEASRAAEQALQLRRTRPQRRLRGVRHRWLRRQLR